MILAKLSTASLHLAATLPFLPGSRTRHHGGLDHPLVSLLLLILIFALILWAFRRKPS